MADPVAAHYRDLLAAHYTWMLGGDLERAAAEQRELLRGLGVASPDRPDAAAVDLGCGPGPQTLALADMGYATVIGVDTSQELLDELVAHAATRPAVKAINMDLVDALPTVTGSAPVEVVVCMRDTILHLPDQDAVTRLFGSVAASLATGGVLVLTYRDLTAALQGLERFMPVRDEEDRIMLCVLDYGRPEAVTVNDLVFARDKEGWTLHKSSYEKLRLAPDWIQGQLEATDLRIVHHLRQPTGMWSTVAQKAS